VDVQSRAVEKLGMKSLPVVQGFSEKRVFLTGHTGFKGSWLAIWLHQLGARVTGYSTPPPTTPSNFVVSRVRELVDSHHDADVRDGTRLGAAVEAADPDVIFHLAAQPIVRESYAHPRETFEVNAIGTASLLDAVRARGKPCAVVIVTSDKCYENHEHVWGYRETDALGGHDPYSASKAATELVASAYRRSFFPPDKLARHGIKIATVRAGNVIGGGDWASDRLVPDAVRSLTVGQAVPLRNPDAVRPWQHVLDPLFGYLSLASRMLLSDDVTLCDAWNFGPLPGADVPVSRLAEWFIEAWGDGSWVDAREGEQPHEAGMLRLSVEKSISRLGWMPRWGPREAVQRAARWYSRHARTNECMLNACLADIADYSSVSPTKSSSPNTSP
jgi:CDP-glucose 4,6-dehydratase